MFNPHESNRYQVLPPASGAQGHLHIECQADSDGRTFLAKQSFRTPVHLSKPHWDGKYLIINVVNPTAGLFAGDHVAIVVRYAGFPCEAFNAKNRDRADDRG